MIETLMLYWDSARKRFTTADIIKDAKVKSSMKASMFLNDLEPYLRVRKKRVRYVWELELDHFEGK